MLKSPIAAIAILGLAALPLALPAGDHAGLFVSQAHAADVKVVVDDEVVTNYDIARRAAFLKLQRQSGNLNAKATDELIDEAIKKKAIRQAGIRIPDKMVDDAFGNFAKRNNLSTGQLTQILSQAGVTADHFKEFIRLQIGWGQTVGILARRDRGLMSEQDVVAKMLERGGEKPTSTEYLLQQVIFVIPESQRGSRLATRRKEANNMRGLVNGCSDTQALAKQVRDVTVRDLGRVLELELPDDWADSVKGLQEGQTTRVRDTDRGVEFLVVCRARSVNDDRVAQLEFSTEALEEAGGDAGAKIFADLKAKARIERR